MGSNGQTIVKYQGVALPLAAVGAVLFDSSAAFPNVNTPSGGSFHMLGLQWFQYALLFTAVGGGVVTGSSSDDKGLTWQLFYTGPTIATDVAGRDEVYVGMYKDVQFIFTPAANTSGFRANLALNPHKATSQANATTDVL